MARRRSGQCALCGNHAELLEQEDIFPTWARNELKAALADSPIDGQWPPRVVLRACADCNRGLGREFEDPAAPVLKPLARGETKLLSRSEMATIAAWARLKEIEYVLGRPVLLTQQGQVSHTDHSLAYWRRQLSALRGTRRPPSGYVVRLALVGSPTDAASYRSFTPHGWRQEHAALSALNGIGLLLIESLRTTSANADRFLEHTRRDQRATQVWPLPRRSALIGTHRVPLNHIELWRRDHQFHPDSGLGGGWRIRVPRGAESP